VDKKYIFNYDKVETQIAKIIDYQKKKKMQKTRVPTGVIILDDITIYKKCFALMD